jgi:RNA polymerase sigma-70 factor (ECF subfamily)
MAEGTRESGDRTCPEGSDESLMLRFGQGDAAAFEELYRRHELASWRFILRSVRQSDVADELLQDVWFAVAQQAGKYQSARNGASFRTWLFTLAHHRIADHFRRYRQHIALDGQGLPEDDAPGGGVCETDLATDSGLGPLRQAQNDELGRALLQAIGALPEAQRLSFLLQAEGEMGVEEIAQVTGASFETTKSRLRYARAQLRAALKEFV